MSDQDHIMSAIEDLIEICRNGQEGYRDGAEHAKDPQIREFLDTVSLERAKFAGDLEGEAVRMGKSDVDVTLIELEDIPDLNFRVYYSGWDRSGVAPAGAVGIHHPNADEKSISFSSNALTTVDSCIGSGNNTHWNVFWYSGVTEPGSSGSGIWDPATHKLVGTLSDVVLAPPKEPAQPGPHVTHRDRRAGVAFVSAGSAGWRPSGWAGSPCTEDNEDGADARPPWRVAAASISSLARTCRTRN